MIPIVAFPRNEWKRPEKHGNEKRTRKRQRQEKKPGAWQSAKMKWKPGFGTVHFQTGSLHENCKFPSGLSDEYGKRFKGRPFRSPLFLDKNSDLTTIIFSHKLLLLIHLAEPPNTQFKHNNIKSLNICEMHLVSRSSVILSMYRC